jgi:hypothetical protein
MTREQEYDVAYAKAVAAADCASSVRMTAVIGIPEGVKNVQAYRDEVKAISDNLTWDADEAQFAANILYLTEDPKDTP